MRHCILSALNIVAATFLVLCAAVAQTTPPSRPDPAAIVAHVETAMHKDRVPGAAIAVIVDGEVILLRGFGIDGDGRPVTLRTGFRLGSMSKAFTALAVMRAVEEGRLVLDAPVVSVLPDFALADPAATAQITLLHLLAQTSGIPRTAPRAAPDATLAEHVAALAATDPAGRPGERHIYASPNYLVAARMLEVAAGRPFAEILSASVLRPLGMADTLVTAAEDKNDLFAKGHRYWFGFPLPADLPEEPGRLATAGLISSAADMARFLRFQLGDGTWDGLPLLGPDAMTEMHRGTAEGDGFLYAMGWRESRIGSTRALHHGGILPDFRGKMILLPDMNAAVVVLTNASNLMPLPASPTSHRLADEIAAYLAGGPLSTGTFSFGTAVLAVWAGLGLLLASQIRALWARRRAAPHSGRMMRHAMLNVAAALVLLAGLPMIFGLSWGEMWSGSPDLVVWSLGMACFAFALGAIDLCRRFLQGKSDK